MLKGINGWTLPTDMPIAEAVRLVRKVGFAAFEPTLNADGELTPTTDEASCRRIGDTIREAGLQVASLATALFWKTNYTSPDESVRTAAHELTIACLDRARWLGSGALLVVPGIVRHDAQPRQLACGYAEALTRSYHALQKLIPEAEQRGVALALENVWNSFMLSPIELADFIDRLNSPWIGAYLDIGNVLKFGMPQDWIDVLGRRIVRIHIKDYRISVGTKEGFVLPGDGDADWPAIINALRQTGYDGPLTFEGLGDLVDISARMDRILTNS